MADLDDDGLSTLQSEIISEFESLESVEPTSASVDDMDVLADMLDTVRSEMSRREVLASELARRASEAASRVYQNKKEEEEDSMESEMAMDTPPMDSEELPPPLPPVEVEVEEESVPMPMPMAMEKMPEDEPSLGSYEEGHTPGGSEKMQPDSEMNVEVEIGEEEEEEKEKEKEELSEFSSVEENATTLQVTTSTPELEAPVTAAVSIEVPADRRPVAQTSAAPVAITAGADIPGYTAGSPLNDMNAVAEAMAKRIHSLRRVNGGDGEQHIVASITTTFPESRTLSTDAEENWNKVQKIVGPEALVAAGGHQAPFETRYDIFGFGTTNRPVRDALPRFQADRGGIRFILPPILSSYANAVDIWTSANDSAETPNPATKASLTVSAATETTVATDAVTLQMQFGNLATRAYPELIARHNELGLIQHAREAEQYLLSKISAGSTAVTTTSLIGFARDYLVQIGRAAVAYRSRHRLEPDASLRIIAPFWIKDAMVADLTLSMPGDSTLNATSEIDGYLSSRNIVMSYSLDSNVYGSQSVGALNEFSDSFVWYMFSEGTFLFLDGGTLDLGIIRDSSLVGTNDYKMFVETFEGVAKVGIESLAVTSTISINGAAAALRDTTGGATAAAIEY